MALQPAAIVAMFGFILFASGLQFRAALCEAVNPNAGHLQE